MRRLARIAAEIGVGVYVVVDTLVAPLFGPVTRWLSSFAVIRRVEGWIAALPPYFILGLLVVPFAVAELAKVYAVLLIGTGHLKTGVGIFIGAYVVSILVCERIFHAGKQQLMTIGWFARLFRWAMVQKERILAWFRTTAMWRFANGLRSKARGALQSLKARLGGMPGGKAGDSFPEP